MFPSASMLHTIIGVHRPDLPVQGHLAYSGCLLSALISYLYKVTWPTAAACCPP